MHPAAAKAKLNNTANFLIFEISSFQWEVTQTVRQPLQPMLAWGNGHKVGGDDLSVIPNKEEMLEQPCVLSSLYHTGQLMRTWKTDVKENNDE